MYSGVPFQRECFVIAETQNFSWLPTLSFNGVPRYLWYLCWSYIRFSAFLGVDGAAD